MAIFLDLLAGGAAVVAVVFCCMGLADNVEVIQGIVLNFTILPNVIEIQNLKTMLPNLNHQLSPVIIQHRLLIHLPCRY